MYLQAGPLCACRSGLSLAFEQDASTGWASIAADTGQFAWSFLAAMHGRQLKFFSISDMLVNASTEPAERGCREHRGTAHLLSPESLTETDLRQEECWWIAVVQPGIAISYNHMGTLLEAFNSQAAITLMCQLLRSTWHVRCILSSAAEALTFSTWSSSC